MTIELTKPLTKEDGASANTDFATVLRELMLAKRISASDLARQVWGTAQDKRGYEVARNRDRIGHYLSGRSHPGRDNLVKMAKALGVKVEVLERVQPAPVVRTAEARSPKDIQVVYSDGIAYVSMLKLQLSSKSVATIMEIIQTDPVHSKQHLVPKSLIQRGKAKPK